jgi:hypothetical protein
MRVKNFNLEISKCRKNKNPPARAVRQGGWRRRMAYGRRWKRMTGRTDPSRRSLADDVDRGAGSWFGGRPLRPSVGVVNGPSNGLADRRGGGRPMRPRPTDVRMLENPDVKASHSSLHWGLQRRKSTLNCMNLQHQASVAHNTSLKRV